MQLVDISQNLEAFKAGKTCGYAIGAALVELGEGTHGPLHPVPVAALVNTKTKMDKQVAKGAALGTTIVKLINQVAKVVQQVSTRIKILKQVAKGVELVSANDKVVKQVAKDVQQVSTRIKILKQVAKGVQQVSTRVKPRKQVAEGVQQVKHLQQVLLPVPFVVLESIKIRATPCVSFVHQALTKIN